MKNNLFESFKRTYYTRLISASIFCLLFAIALLWSSLLMGIQNTEKQFNSKAEAALIDLQQQLNRNNSLIDSLVSWHHSQGTTHPSALRLFARKMLDNYQHVSSIFYTPKIVNEYRKQFEYEMRADGYSTYSINKIGENGFLPVENRPYYFPITQIEPLKPSTAGILGFDMNTLSDTASALDYAIRYGESALAQSDDLLPGGKVLLIFKAVYKGRTVPESEQSRLEQLEGVYVVSVLSQELMESILENINKKNTSVNLSYSNNGNSQLIAEHLSATESDLSLFPTSSFKFSLQQFNQFFELELRRHINVNDLKVGLMVIILLVCMLIIYLINLSLRRDLGYSISNQLSKDEIYREKELAEVTLHSIADGVICTDKNDRVEHMNEVAELLCGRSLKEARLQPLTEVMITFNEESGEHESKIFLAKSLDNKGEAKANCILKNVQNKQYHIRVSAACIRDREQQYVGAIIVFHDVTNERELTQLLAYQARHDELTGLYNRREFETQLQHSLSNNQLNRSTDVLCYVDLDQFKLVNDTCGHVAGDELLKQVTLVIKSNIRSSDFLARLGGDEFGIIYRNVDMKQALIFSTRLQNAVREHRFIWESKIFNIGSSMGLVEINAEFGGIEELMIAADSTCYMAKDKGRNRIFCHTVDDRELQMRHGEMQWTHKIKCAFAENRFCLYRQKVKPLTGDQRVTHYEVLLRMKGVDGDIISPLAFIPAAERYNVMLEIDEWVVRHALKAMVEEPGEDIYNINLSGKSINDESLLVFITNEIKSSGVKPERLCFEITETAAIANLIMATEFINELRELGCEFALDDFGSGLSSFAYLKNLPVDYLKIDGVFVREMLNDKIDYAMVNSIVQVGRVMGIKTIAEYVENPAIELELIKLGVDYGQGYAIHKPSPWGGGK